MSSSSSLKNKCHESAVCPVRSQRGPPGAGPIYKDKQSDLAHPGIDTRLLHVKYCAVLISTPSNIQLHGGSTRTSTS